MYTDIHTLLFMDYAIVYIYTKYRRFIYIYIDIPDKKPHLVKH